MTKVNCISRYARITIFVGLLSSLICDGTALAQASSPQRADRMVLNGQSKTVLPDGRLLLTGGNELGAYSSTVYVEDTKTGKITESSGKLIHARAHHSATLLPNGKVLIFGGVGAGDSVVPNAEFFDPETQKVEAITSMSVAPRTQHSATVLTDGRVMIAGGKDPQGHSTKQIEVWDYRTGTASTFAVGLAVARYGQSATLQADGSVLLWGGEGDDGAPLSYGEVIDPNGPSVRFVSTQRQLFQSADTPYVIASIPQNGESGILTNQVLSLRFSEPMDPAKINSTTITLMTASASVQARVVAVEGGALAFITPASSLLNGTSYSIAVSGVDDLAGHAVRSTSIGFTTVAVIEGASATGGSEATSTSGVAPSGVVAGAASRGINSSWRAQPALRAQLGVTALSGLVLKLDGSPLANVRIQIDSQMASTDSTGRFLVENTGSGHHVMIIDGAPANSKSTAYGLYRVGVDLKAGITNTLGYTIWMTELDTEHVVHIPSPTTSEVVVTSPKIPGLEVHIPAGTVIRDTHGNAVTEVGLTELSTTQPPFPIKNGIHFPIYFTLQPGGATFENTGNAWSASVNHTRKGATIVYKNYTKSGPGTRQTFWNYDPTQRGWYSYGKGRVSANAARVVPDEGTQIFSFDAASVEPGNPDGAPQKGPNHCSECDGDPVDLQTGLFVYTQTDLRLNDVVPIEVTRTYRQADPVSRAFGIGTSLNYDLFFVGDSEYTTNGQTYQELIFPDGGKVHFSRTTPCAAGQCADGEGVYTATSTPTDFYGATNQGFDDGYFHIVKIDGTQFYFPPTSGADFKQEYMTAIVDRHGNTVRLNRNLGNGNLLSVTSPNGRWIQFTYDSSNRITSTQDNIGRTTSYTYNTAGYLETATDANGGVTTYSYDSDGNMTSIKNPRQIVYVQNEYDSNGMVSKQTHADGGIYQFAYTLDTNGNVTQTDVTDPRGFVRRVVYNSDGFSTSDTFALGQPEQQTTTYTRQQGTGIILNSTDALNRTTAYSYDSMANVTSVTRLAGTENAVTNTYSYDQRFYQVSSATDPLGNTTTYSYDDTGNLLSVTDPLGNTSSFTYNTSGQPITATDPLGNQSQFAYNSGDPVSVTDPLSRTTTSFTDGAGRVVAVTDPLGRKAQTVYDPLDRVVSTTDALGDQTSFTYDGDGNRLTITDANQHTTSYEYDDLDRLASTTDPLGQTNPSGHTTNYQYDLNGNVASTTDRKGQTTTVDYDPLNRPKMMHFQDGSSVTNTYDAGSRITSIVDSTSGSIARSFDGLDRVLSETTAQGSVGYTYDASGRRQTMTVSGQSPVSYSFDNANRLTSVVQGAASVAFSYDSMGRRISMTLPNGITANYSYDAASQLTGIAYQGGGLGNADLIYSYDLAGRRISVGGTLASTQLPSAVSATAYNANNQLTQWGATAMSYDANGNTLSDGMNAYTWDARNRLVSANSNAARFTYDPVGRRAGKTILSTNTNFLYDGVNPVQELDGSTVTANLLTGIGVDERFMRTDAAGPSIFLTDALGSTVALADAAGNTTSTYSYGPYGMLSATGTSDNSYTYTGRESDGLGVYYYRARYYSPQTGRFISEDSAGFGGSGTNLYAYVFDNPINVIDPFGLSGWLTIYSSGTSGLGNHSWISYTPDNGTTTTYGTWGNNPNGLGNGLQTNLELGRSADASRSEYLSDAQEAALMALIQKYRKQGANGWKLGSPCSAFAADAWHSGTGETLNTQWGPISNPTTLTNSIISANGGLSNLVLRQPPNGSSSWSNSYGSNSSSSSSSSGSSLNSSGSSLR